MQHFVAEQTAHRCLRLSELCFGLQASENRKPPVTNITLAVFPAHGIGNALCVGERQPNVVIAARRDSGESLLSDSNNRERNIIQFNRAADDVARAAEGALPVAVIQNGHRRRGRRIVAGLKYAAHCRFHAHRTEEVSRNELAVENRCRAVP